MSGHSPVGTFRLVPGSVPTGVRSLGACIRGTWFEVSTAEARTRTRASLRAPPFPPQSSFPWGWSKADVGLL